MLGHSALRGVAGMVALALPVIAPAAWGADASVPALSAASCSNERVALGSGSEAFHVHGYRAGHRRLTRGSARRDGYPCQTRPRLGPEPLNHRRVTVKVGQS